MAKYYRLRIIDFSIAQRSAFSCTEHWFQPWNENSVFLSFGESLEILSLICVTNFRQFYLLIWTVLVHCVLFCSITLKARLEISQSHWLKENDSEAMFLQSTSMLTIPRSSGYSNRRNADGSSEHRTIQVCLAETWHTRIPSRSRHVSCRHGQICVWTSAWNRHITGRLLGLDRGGEFSVDHRCTVFRGSSPILPEIRTLYNGVHMFSWNYGGNGMALELIVSRKVKEAKYPREERTLRQQESPALLPFHVSSQ